MIESVTLEITDLFEIWEIRRVPNSYYQILKIVFFFYFSSIKISRSEVNNFLPAWFDVWIILQIRINHLYFIFCLKFNDSPCFILIQWYFFTLMLPYRNGFCFCLVSQVSISSCSDTELMFKCIGWDQFNLIFFPKISFSKNIG